MLNFRLELTALLAHGLLRTQEASKTPYLPVKHTAEWTACYVVLRITPNQLYFDSVCTFSSMYRTRKILSEFGILVYIPTSAYSKYLSCTGFNIDSRFNGCAQALDRSMFNTWSTPQLASLDSTRCPQTLEPNQSSSQSQPIPQPQPVSQPFEFYLLFESAH